MHWLTIVEYFLLFEFGQLGHGYWDIVVSWIGVHGNKLEAFGHAFLNGQDSEKGPEAQQIRNVSQSYDEGIATWWNVSLKSKEVTTSYP